MKKRGVFYLIDVLIAVSILITTIVLALQFTQDPEDNINSELNVLASFMDSITSTEVRDLQDSYVYELINQKVVEPDTPVYIAIADLYRRNVSGELSLSYAQNLTKNVTKLIQTKKQYGFYYMVNGTILYSKSFATINASKKRVTMQKMTFFSYKEADEVKLYGPISTNVSLWIS